MSTGLISVNPADGTTWWESECWSPDRTEAALREIATAAEVWKRTPLEQRVAVLLNVARELRSRRDALAALVTREMGKLAREARAEIDKCAWGCEFFAQHGPAWLADEEVPTDAARSFIRYEALGTVLAIMPWNFPLWQVVRCAAPALLAGNTIALKHASNTMQCALALEQVFAAAGAPPGVFRALLIDAATAQQLIGDRRIHAVSLTGSEAAGRRVAQTAGQHLKKCVLELGGSDPFIVLADADLERAVRTAVTARFQNAGQSCIAAKRFIVVDPVADEFIARFAAAIDALRPGDPVREDTTLAPLARADLRDVLHAQVQASVRQGAALVRGGQALPGAGYYYAATLLDHVMPGMACFDEEVFGPVATVSRARDTADAVRLARATRFGLGAAVWTADRDAALRIAGELRTGMLFVNAQVKSDPRLPFGGVGDSGFGRELGRAGLLEFTNIKPVWIAG